MVVREVVILIAKLALQIISQSPILVSPALAAATSVMSVPQAFNTIAHSVPSEKNNSLGAHWLTPSTVKTLAYQDTIKMFLMAFVDVINS